MSVETANALQPVVECCLAQTKRLEELLEKALPAEGDSTWRRRKKALASLAHGTVVQDIMSQLESHLPHLLYSQALNGPAPSCLPVLLGTSQPSRPNTESGSQPRFMVTFPREENFTGREDIIKEIDRRFGAQQPCVAIAGVGGVGKSQIATEYCYRHVQGHPEAHVFWVHASNLARFTEAYHRIGKELGLSGVDNPEVDTLQLVQKWLSNDANGPWLLVVDNADDIESFFGLTHEESAEEDGQQPRALFNYLPQSLNGSMIVTTRDTRIGQRLAKSEKPIVVLPFEMTDAKHLLQKTLLENDLDSDHSAGLLEALDFLPMAITQAAAFIRENGISLFEYLGYLRAGDKEAKDLLAEAYHDPGRDLESRNSVLQTSKISFDCIRRQKPRAAEILSLMAMLDRQAIQKYLLRKDDEQDIDFAVAIGTLKAFSLITEGKEKGTFGMHRLIQLSTQRWLEVENVIGEWQQNAMDVVSKLCTDDHAFSGDWKNWGAISPHVQVVLSYVPVTEPFLLERAVMLHRLAIYKLEQGYFVNAAANADEALATIQRIEGDHPKKLAIATTAAILLSLQGKFEAAEKMHQQVLEHRKRAFGPTHPDTLTSLADVANALRSQGKYGEAEALYRQTTDAWIASPALETHRFRYTSLSGLAWTLEAQGKHEEAEENIRKAIEGCTKVVGAKHPWTTRNFALLILILMSQDKWMAAEPLARKVLQDFECSLGPQHMYSLDSLHPLAIILESQGRFEEAETLRRRALDGLERVFSAQHQDTKNALSALAYAPQKQAKYKEAESALRQLPRACEKPGPEDLSACQTMSRLAYVLEKQKKWEEAERLRRRVFDGLESIRGPEHEDTISALDALAVVLRRIAKYEEAESALRRVLFACEQRFDPLRALCVITRLAHVLEKQEKWEEAERLKRRVLHGFESLRGLEHEHTLLGLMDMACAQEKWDDCEGAESAIRQALCVYEDKFGPADRRTLFALTALAPVLEHQAKYMESEQVSLRAFRAYGIAYGPRHPFVVLCLGHVAVAMVAQGKFGAVEAMCRPLLDSYVEELGPRHSSLPPLLDMMAEALANLGKYEEAEPLSRQALDIYEETLGVAHTNAVLSLNRLAVILEKQTKYEAAEAIRRGLLETLEKVLGPEHACTIDNVFYLAWILDGQMKYDEASVLYQRACASFQKVFGPDHPGAAACLKNFALLKASSQNKWMSFPRYFHRFRRFMRVMADGKASQGRHRSR